MKTDYLTAKITEIVVLGVLILGLILSAINIYNQGKSTTTKLINDIDVNLSVFNRK